MKISQRGFQAIVNRVLLAMCGSICVLAILGVVINLFHFLISNFSDTDFGVMSIGGVIYSVGSFLIFWSLLWRYPNLYLDQYGITFKLLFVSDFVGWDEIEKVQDRKTLNCFGLLLKEKGRKTFWNHKHFLLTGPIGKPIIHLSIDRNEIELIKKSLTNEN